MTQLYPWQQWSVSSHSAKILKLLLKRLGVGKQFMGPLKLMARCSCILALWHGLINCYSCINMVAEFLSHLRVQYTRFKKKNEIFSYSTSLTGFGKVSPLVIQDLTKDSLTKALVVQNSTRCLKGQMKILSQAKPALQNNWNTSWKIRKSDTLYVDGVSINWP